jgi:hypothetical protein
MYPLIKHTKPDPSHSKSDELMDQYFEFFQTDGKQSPLNKRQGTIKKFSLYETVPSTFETTSRV